MDHSAPPESTNSPEKQWIDTINAQGWNEDTQVIHLEGFIRDKGLFSEFIAYAARAAAEENAESEDCDVLSFGDAIDNIKEVLRGVDGVFLAHTHNSICLDLVSYQGDSLFNRRSDVALESFGEVIEDIEEVLKNADGEDLAMTYNRICSDTIEYLGDSVFKKSVPLVDRLVRRRAAGQ